MKERPIIFSGESVRAILAGRKTQTRRVVKPQPEDFAPGWVRVVVNGQAHTGPADYLLNTVMPEFAAPWRPGDRLWVRETWCPLVDPAGDFAYRATDTGVVAADDDGNLLYRKDGRERSPWLSPIHMPRRASRLTLEVVSVRVERLQAITEADARAEGVEPNVYNMGAALVYLHSFRRTWDALNAKRGYGWDENPWVWCVASRKVEGAA